MNPGAIALIVGIIGLVVAGFGFMQGWQNHDARPLMSWLIGFGFWLAVAVGMLFLVQIWYVFHARWPIVIRRQCEHYLAVFPWLFLLFLPLVAVPFLHENPGLLWKWMNGVNPMPGNTTVGADPLYQWKQPYLNVGFFALRVILIFGAFTIISELLRKWSFDTDRSGDIKNTHNARRLSAIGLFICAAAATAGAIDWFKSLEYHWFSTMYGVWFFAASMRAALAFIIILCVILATKGYLKGIFNQAHRYDIGCMMLAFTVFWAYISFSQYFIIYNANIPEEVFWYSIREKEGWWNVSMGLIFGQFLFPFLLLLWYKTKVVVWRSVFVSCWILAFTVLDLFWNIIPGKIPADNEYGYTVRPFSIEIYDIAALVGIGGICIWVMLRSMKKTEPIPIRDPNILKSINYAE
jgi:hypothetical protein